MMKILVLISALALVLAEEEFDTANCLREPEPGMCKAYFELYYYDYKSRSCKTFIYGGCDGNENSFGTEEECMEKCGDVYVFPGRS